MKVKKSIAIIAITIATVVIVMTVIWILYNPYANYEPQVGLSVGQMLEPGIWKVRVDRVPSVESLSGFDVTLTKNGSIVIPKTSLRLLDSMCSGNPAISFIDELGDTNLNVGDYFIVCGTDSVSEYEVNVFWRASGNEISGLTGQIIQ